MEQHHQKCEMYACVVMVLVTVMVTLEHMDSDLAWAATLVPGGTEKLGDGVKDAAKTAGGVPGLCG